MGAVAVMPLAALMMGVGYWITSVGEDNAVMFGDLLHKTGAAVLDNLGVIFAIAIAYGLSKDNSGAAALAGFVGFATLVNLIGPDAIAGYRGIDPAELTGDEALQWAEAGWNGIGYGNVLFGIMIGILAAWTYNRFYQTQLPDALAFFSGRRLVPILASIFSAVVAGIMYIIWPLVYSALFSFGAWIQGLGAVGAGLYGFANRLLIPTRPWTSCYPHKTRLRIGGGCFWSWAWPTSSFIWVSSTSSSASSTSRLQAAKTMMTLILAQTLMHLPMLLTLPLAPVQQLHLVIRMHKLPSRLFVASAAKTILIRLTTAQRDCAPASMTQSW